MKAKGVDLLLSWALYEGEYGQRIYRLKGLPVPTEQYDGGL